MASHFLVQPCSQVLCPTSRCVLTHRREPWERGWALLKATVTFIKKVKVQLFLLFVKWWESDLICRLWLSGFLHVLLKYPKIPKVSPDAYLFQGPFLRVFPWRGLYSGMAGKNGGKFELQNRLGKFTVGRKFMSPIYTKFLLKLAFRK